ncbi:MAG TPA: MEDS domain-containing protein [Candidatus Saccharimonadales bacterium]|nr:MEDS domain-containing protein [Candidatus Saccharimonadales bacterium]
MNPNKPIHVAGRALGEVRHICAFFHTKEEEYRTLKEFIKEGLERNEKGFHIVDSKHCENHCARLEEEGVPASAARKSGQLKVACWEDAYLQDDHFDQNRQIKLIETVLQQGKKEGYPLTRLVANMEWALEEKAGVEDIVEYESRLNYVLPNYEDPVICTYDLSRFNAGVAMDILRTHPLVIVGGVLQENPLYVPPDEFLKELEERRAMSA